MPWDGEELSQGAVVAVGEGVVAYEPAHLDPLRGEDGEAAGDEGADGRRALVGWSSE